MGRIERIPAELRKRPFTLQEARDAGISRHRLQGRSWLHIGTELYCRKGLRNDPLGLISAWKSLLPSDAVFAGGTAAWLWGLDLRPTNPIEVILPLNSGVRSRSGLTVRRCELRPGDVADTRGFRATALPRTLRDLCARMPAVEALTAIDMAVRLRLVDPTALVAYAKDCAGRSGAKRLRALALLSAPAESPMETRLRWLLLQGGLPCPEVQVELRDDDGRFVGRADLYYRATRLVIEYDGDNHRGRLVEDDRRQNLIVDAGFKLLRFTASDLQQPEMVQALVVSQLRDATAKPRLAPNAPTPRV